MPDYIFPHTSGFTTDTWTPQDNLFAGDQDPIERKVTLLSGEVRARGTVLGIVTASTKYKMSASAAGDGSQTPVAILAHDSDATLGDIEVIVYEAGTFNENALILGAGHTIASIRAGLRDVNINLKKNIPAT
jgi:hypothetical protein